MKKYDGDLTNQIHTYTQHHKPIYQRKGMYLWQL